MADDIGGEVGGGEIIKANEIKAQAPALSPLTIRQMVWEVLQGVGPKVQKSKPYFLPPRWL